MSMKTPEDMTMEEIREQLAKDNNIKSAIEGLTEEQLAEFNSSQNKKGPKYDMKNVKVVMPMKTEEC